MNSDPVRRFRMGLVVNPYAGIGGAQALKGSDDPVIQQRAAAGHVGLTAPLRVQTFFVELLGRLPPGTPFEVITVAGAMGGDWVPDSIAAHQVDYLPAQPSTADDTRESVMRLQALGVDLLLFAGGDGTARVVCDVAVADQPCLGLPAGVKMQSGVFAINPQLAAALVARLVEGHPTRLLPQEVRDIDEGALREGRIRSRYYGSLSVPDECDFVQAVKQGGLIQDELIVDEIAEYLLEELDSGTLIVAGPGRSVQRILETWGIDGTLMGIDLIHDRRLLGRDVNATGLLDALTDHSAPVALLLSVIGGQGHIIGRGNQQLTPAVLRCIGRTGLRVLAPPAKLRSLHGRPLLIDSGDPALDRDWSGTIAVTSGYRDVVLYPLAGG